MAFKIIKKPKDKTLVRQGSLNVYEIEGKEYYEDPSRKDTYVRME
jgi:hypothetical protein